MRKHFMLVAVGAAMLLISAGAHAASVTKPYIAGSAGITLNNTPVTINEAGGAVDCSTGVGGNCFEVVPDPLVGPFFQVSAIDDLGGSVGIFMGFDMDGDGCVACKNGSVLGQDGDVFFQGADTVTGFIPQNWRGQQLFVFVRIATLNTGDIGSTGTLTFTPGCADDGSGRQCKPDVDPQMGTVCTGAADPSGGPGGCTQVMYPYPGH